MAMFTSKWKLIGFVFYLLLRLAVSHPIATAANVARDVIECRVGRGRP
jgi:hypothetical protein